MSRFEVAEAEFRPLGIDTRTINALIAQDISCLRELSTLTERELARFPGIGPKAVGQLRIYLREEGPSVPLHTLPRAVSVIFDAKSLTAIDAWAVDHGDMPRATAIRRLVEQALATMPSAGDRTRLDKLRAMSRVKTKSRRAP